VVTSFFWTSVELVWHATVRSTQADRHDALDVCRGRPDLGAGTFQFEQGASCAVGQDLASRRERHALVGAVEQGDTRTRPPARGRSKMEWSVNELREADHVRAQRG